MTKVIARTGTFIFDGDKWSSSDTTLAGSVAVLNQLWELRYGVEVGIYRETMASQHIEAVSRLLGGYIVPDDKPSFSPTGFVY